MKIKKFIENVLKDKSNKLHKYSLGKLTYKEIRKIKETASIDLRNYTRIIDSYGIKHALKKHSNNKKEKLRGQIAITLEDFQKIKEIVKNSDKIKIIGKAKRGGILIEYTKRINVEYIYIEEQRNKEVAMKTMFKRK